MRHARLAGRPRVRDPNFKVFETSSTELRIAPVALGVPVARLRALADFFSILPRRRNRDAMLYCDAMCLSIQAIAG
jgi:hypothetical protein